MAYTPFSLATVAAGDTFPWPVPTGGATPSSWSDPRNSVSMRQARLALYQTPSTSGTGTLLDDVNAAVSGATDQSVPIWWEFASTVQIDDPIVYELGTAMGLTQDTIEALFTLAASL